MKVQTNWRKTMNLTTQTQTSKTPFQNLDVVSGLIEISDENAAICSGGAEFRLYSVEAIKTGQDLFGSDDIYTPFPFKEHRKRYNY
jgi:hypothetical protein